MKKMRMFNLAAVFALLAMSVVVFSGITRAGGIRWNPMGSQSRDG